jgi:hypothetical protein
LPSSMKVLAGRHRRQLVRFRGNDA